MAKTPDRAPSRGASKSTPPVLVVGGGVTGQRAALDLLHAGLKVLLVERGDSLGGTVAQLGPMFPLHNCLLCRGEALHGPGCTRPTISPELLDRARPDGLSVWTRSRVEEVRGGPGAWRVTIVREPRHVEPSLCISCDRCARVCPHEEPDPFQAGLAPRKAAYRPSERAVPDSYAIARGPWCEGCGRCVAACPTNAIDLAETARTESVTASAIVLATGMRLYDAARSGEYGFGRYPNVFTGLEVERMSSPAGPGEGRIVRRSDGLPPERIAWLQCVGSRDKTRDYCSAFCCGYATRQAVQARQILPSAAAHIYLMDDRVFSKDFSATYDPLRTQYGIRLERSRLSVLREDPATRDLLLQVTIEDGRVTEERFGMVVLSVGAEAAAEAAGLAKTLGLEPDAFGFVRTETLAPVDTPRPGIFVAGAAAGPADIADSVTQGSAAAARVCSFLGHAPKSPQTKSPKTDPPEDVLVPAETIPPAAAVSAESRRRIGVLACECAGEIGGVVDLSDVMLFAAGLPNVEMARILPFGCLPEGLESIRQAVREHALTDVLICACNRRTFTPLFAGTAGAAVELVSLREECSYVHHDEPFLATRKARELVRVAIERVRRAPAGPPILVVKPVREALVVGGGLAGLIAGLHLADAGIPVHLVEREARLGGHALELNRSPEGVDIPAMIEQLVARAREHPRMNVHVASEIVRHAGYLGRFSAVVRQHGNPSRDVLLNVGATVVATGGDEYRGPAYGLGVSPRVITLLELGQRLRAKPDLASRFEQVVFIGCVGPWDEPANVRSWRCSRSCCETMVRQARALKEANPAGMIAVLVREVNTYSFREEDYTAARNAGVLFVRFGPAERPTLEKHGKGIRLYVLDQVVQETLEFRPDLVVLSAAILPRSDARDTGSRLGVPVGAEGFVREWEAKTLGFSSLEPGVFVCGLAQGPKPVREVIGQSLAAAQQALAHLQRERVVHAGSVADIDAKRCASCLTCVRSCPYEVPRIGTRGFPAGWPRGKPFIDPSRCQGCGTCVSECPARAIRFDRYDDEQSLGGGQLGRWLVASGG
jgi:heterodisulfide reductase subunit A